MFKRPVSLAHLVKQQIYDRIERDGYADTQGQLPSEPQLAAELGVSRATIREALTILAREGVIVRRHGVGTFVNANLPDLKSNFAENIEFEDLITQQGYEAGVKVLRAGLGRAGPVASHFGLNEDAGVYFVDKVFLANGTPVIFVHNAVPVTLVLPAHRVELRDQVDGREPIYRFLYERCQQEVIYQISNIKAAAADASLAEELACPLNHPLLCIEEIGYNGAQEPVLYCLEYHRSDIIRFDAIRRVVRPFSWEMPGANRS